MSKKKWRGFQATRPLPGFTEQGQKLMKLMVGESIEFESSMIPPSDIEPAEIDFGGIRWKVEPIGGRKFRFTRVK